MPELAIKNQVYENIRAKRQCVHEIGQVDEERAHEARLDEPNVARIIVRGFHRTGRQGHKQFFSLSFSY